MEEFRIIPLDEFLGIRTDELQIIRLLRPNEVYLVDDYGDLLMGDDGREIVDPTVIVEPKELVVPVTNQFASALNGRGIPDTVPYTLIDGYEDVFGLDVSLVRVASGTPDIWHANDNSYDGYHDYVGYHARVLGYFIDGVYQGCVWFFTSDSWPGYLGLYGIRASIANALLGVRGVARKLVTFVIGGGIKGTREIVVPWPLDPMPSLLLRLGFVHYNDPRDTEAPVRKFLYPITSTYDYYVYLCKPK